MAVAAGLVLGVLALVVYMATQTERYYDHFVWQAAAFLEGQAAIRYPVAGTDGSLGNAYFQDVLPILSSDGVPRGLLPFPPLPAVLLLPFVAVWGLHADDQTLFTILAAVDVAICWWMLGRLPVRPSVRLGTTVFFAFGTVFWYTGQLVTTWYQAHVVAVGLTLLAVGLALRADPGAASGDHDEKDASATGGVATATHRPAPSEPWRAPPPTSLRDRLAVDPRQFLVGLLFGLAATARLSVIFGAPFLLFVGAGGGRWRRGWSAGLGAAIPVALLLAYNVVSSGHLIQPAYDYLYRLEATAYTALGYDPEWSVEDVRYLPQNAAIMFLSTPDIFPAHLPDSLGVADKPVCTDPDARRRLFDTTCPLAVPRDTGMSVLLTSPAFLLMGPALWHYRRRRLVIGAALAILAIVIFNLMHFSQGWVQFGYRFSNDAVPFVLPLVALGFERLLAGGRRWAMPIAIGLIAISVAVNAWGVVWGTLLGW